MSDISNGPLSETDPVAYWRQAVLEASAEYGLQKEVTEVYDREIANGAPPDAAFFAACCEWDL